MSWFTRSDKLKTAEGERKVRTEGLWQKCDQCREIIWKKDLEASHHVCPRCGAHFRIDAMTRLRLLFDGEQFEQFDNGLVSSDPLRFVDSKPYGARLAAMQKSTMTEPMLPPINLISMAQMCTMRPLSLPRAATSASLRLVDFCMAARRAP